LLWNTDETQLNAMKRFKVICQIPLVETFLDGLQRGATGGNIKSGLRMSGV
jgi:hypothetical protein